MVYQPREDSKLLKECIPKKLKGKKVLEIGCGSGILSITVAKNKGEITAVDIDKKAINETKKLFEKNKLSIKLLEGDKFKPLEKTEEKLKQNQSKKNEREKFDIIICNPPYLPNEEKDRDVALDGGPNGWEFIEELLKEAKKHLKRKGKIILLFSNRTNKEKVDEIIKNNKYKKKLLKQKNVGFFEELYVYQIKTNEIKLKEKNEVEKNKEKTTKMIITKKKHYANGKRGSVYTAELNNKIIGIKEHKKESKANTIENEARFLKILNKKGIGPKFIAYENNKLYREWIDGKQIEEFLEETNEEKAREIISQIIKQCKIMDEIKINKLEMTNPYKHILITKEKQKNKKNKLRAIMIDFERCKFTEKPKNITQFCQYLSRERIHKLLEKKQIKYDVEKIKELGMKYKQNNYDNKKYEELKKIFKTRKKNKVKEEPTSFAKKIYKKLKEVPKGKITTYKELAKATNSKAYRQVGQALKKNPYAPKVPCHRVIKSDGTIGGFEGETKGGKINKKITLLEQEGITTNKTRTNKIKIKEFKQKMHKFE